MEQTRIAIVGVGMIGQAWVLLFARAGFGVSIWDPDGDAPERARQALSRQLADLGENGLLDEDPEAILSRIEAGADLEGTVSRADYVQENGPENLEIRTELFARIDALAPAGSPVASSTSGMPPSSFTEALPGRDRCLVAHPANPPSLLPLVELCPAPWTSPETVETARALLKRAGREIAVLAEERDGFILNRLQGALLAEAFRLVADDVVSPRDVDTVMKHALGPRWSFMGPFETVDLNAPGGIADFCERYGGLYEGLQHQMPPREWDRDLVEKIAAARREDLPLDELPRRQEWRDRRLMALAAFRAGQPTD